MRKPYFNLYVRDWLADGFILQLSHAAEATYLRLLCHQWDFGEIPEEPRAILRLTKCSPAEFKKVWKELEPKFPVVGTGRRNPRLERERAEYEAYLEEKRSRASAGARARWKHSEGNAPAMPAAMPEALLPAMREQCLEDATSPASAPSPVSDDADAARTREAEQARITAMLAAVSGRLTPEGAEALEALVRKANSPVGLIGEVAGVLDGMRPGTPSDPAAVSRALCDLRMTGDQVRGTALRTFVQRAARELSEAANPSAPSTRPAPRDHVDEARDFLRRVMAGEA